MLAVIAQIIGPGVFFPMYTAWDLFMGPHSNVPIAGSTLHFSQITIPVSLMLGGVLPALTLLLPSPSWMTYDTKQYLIVVIQLWPVLVSTVIQILAPLRTAAQERPHRKSHHGSLCRFALTCASVSHLGVYTVAAASVISPTHFGRALSADIHPFRLMLPVLPWSGARTDSAEEGVFWLLQWDYTVASVSVLLWAVEHFFREKWRRVEKVDWTSFALDLLIRVVFCGPCGAAVQLMWARENLLQRDDGDFEGEKRPVA